MKKKRTFQIKKIDFKTIIIVNFEKFASVCLKKIDGYCTSKIKGNPSKYCNKYECPLGWYASLGDIKKYDMNYYKKLLRENNKDIKSQLSSSGNDPNEVLFDEIDYDGSGNRDFVLCMEYKALEK